MIIANNLCDLLRLSGHSDLKNPLLAMIQQLVLEDERITAHFVNVKSVSDAYRLRELIQQIPHPTFGISRFQEIWLL